MINIKDPNRWTIHTSIKTSGIYCFYHRTKPFIYIGSSVNIQERYNSHIGEFNRGTHHNASLQKDYCDDLLNFDILAKGISKDRLIKMEQEYCEMFLEKGFMLYNSKMPRPLEFDNDMICSKKHFDRMMELVEENRMLKLKIGELSEDRKPSEDNIFVELLEGV